MIEITKQTYKQIKSTNVKMFYKQHLQGQTIINPVLGKILFTQIGLGETIHRTKRNLRPFICLLKELVETGECNGQLEALYKARKDRITGFYHIKNTIKLSFIKVKLDILVAQDQDGNKYYMFKKDPQGYLGEELTSHRGPSGSTIIITEKDKNVNDDQDLQQLKVGDVFWIGDCIKLKILQNNYKEEQMDYKKLNEQLQKFVEENLNELSYETKKSYLAKRQAQFDKAQAAMNKAQRLVNSTELNKQQKRNLDAEQIKQVADNIADELENITNTTFYCKYFNDWAEIKGKDLMVNIGLTSKYLKVRVNKNTSSEDYKLIEQESFNLNDFNLFRLNKKIISFIKKVLKATEKQTTVDKKNKNVIDKLTEQIAKILSKFYGNVLDPTIPEHEHLQKMFCNTSNANNNKCLVGLKPFFVSNTQGPDKDYKITAVFLTDHLEVKVYDQQSRWIYTINGLQSTFEDKQKALNNILDQLKQKQSKGKSTLNADKKKLQDKKEQAEQAAKEFKSLIKTVPCDKIEDIKENGNSYEILTHEWGQWGTADDWKEDNDFMRPTSHTARTADKLCDKMSKKYPDLKFTYGVSEKRMLSFYVEY